MERSDSIGDWLVRARKALRGAGIGTADLDALVLLEDCLGPSHMGRAHLLAHPEFVLTPAQINMLDEHLARRMTHEPLAYIRGKTEFYGRDFAVTQDVLEPRPESETMLDLLKKVAQDDQNSRSWRIADVGSGSGCLGITAALELSLMKADFYDIDPATLKLAKANAAVYRVEGNFIESDLIAAARGSYDIILANLPYVPDSFHINQAAMNEPRIAIYGGSDGLDLYRRLFLQLKSARWLPAFVFTEALPPQHEQLAEVAQLYGFVQAMRDDFIQVFHP